MIALLQAKADGLWSRGHIRNNVLAGVVARIDGSYKRTPFFSADTGAPIVTPKVLSRGERERLMSAV
jgi:hypothetical protein